MIYVYKAEKLPEKENTTHKWAAAFNIKEPLKM